VLKAGLTAILARTRFEKKWSAVRARRSVRTCVITGVPGKPPFDITLNVKVTPLKREDADEAGAIHLRRQQVDVGTYFRLERYGESGDLAACGKIRV
jgi:hypothetical protein